jgi:hypothetical protein
MARFSNFSVSPTYDTEGRALDEIDIKGGAIGTQTSVLELFLLTAFQLKCALNNGPFSDFIIRSKRA